MSEPEDPVDDVVDPPRARLWFTSDRERFFLIPSQAERPEGAVSIRTLTGGVDRVSAEALEAWEVSREAAAAHVDDRWADAVAEFRDTWRRVVGAPPSDTKPDLSAFLGVSPGEAIVDDDKRREGRRSLVDRVGRILQPKRWDDARLDRAEEQLDALGAKVRDAGRALSGEAAKVADTLEEGRPGFERAVHDAGEALADVGGQAVDRLRDVFASAAEGEE